MTSQSLTVYSLIRPSSLLREIPILIGFNLLLVACACLSINLPFSPVPITGQTFGVLVVAMVLGRIRGTAIVAAYLLEGLAGIPVFAGGKAGVATILGPTGGYLIGFLAAAYLVGYLADRGWDRGYLKSTIAMIAGTAVIFVCGLVWLSAFVPANALAATGLVPFIPGAAVKIALASALLPSIWRFVGNTR